MVIDFHSHILPGLDDGSKSMEESLAMLRAEKADTVIATPHFYANAQRLDSFLEKRDALCNELAHKKDCALRLGLAAEAAYFPGIGQAERIGELCVLGTDVLLLELPYAEWTPAVIKDTEQLSGRFRLVLAHLERYLSFRKNRAYIRSFTQMPLTPQINAGSLLGFRSRMRVKRWIGESFVLGTDAHNVAERAPNLSEGRAALSDKQLIGIDTLGEALLKGCILK